MNLSDKLISLLPDRKEEYGGTNADVNQSIGYNQALDDMAEKFKKVEWDEEKILDILLKELPSVKEYPHLLEGSRSRASEALTQADLIKET